MLRLKHYSIPTERCFCDWIRRYIRFHQMRSREDLGDRRREAFGVRRLAAAFDLKSSSLEHLYLIIESANTR